MKGAIFVAGTIVFVIVAFTAFFFLQAQSMRSFCSDIRIGDGVSDLRQKVAATYSFRTTGDLVSNGDLAFYVRSDWSMGRFTCQVRYSGNKILLARYVGSD